MAKYICIKTYISINGTTPFKKGETYEAIISPDFRHYLVSDNENDNRYYSMRFKSFYSCFEKVFIFGR